jgi:hypothetical protein
MLEEILDRRNLEKTLKAVQSNKGSGGVDGMQTDELRHYLTHHYQVLKKEILEGNLPTKRCAKGKHTEAARRYKNVRYSHGKRPFAATSRGPMVKPKVRGTIFQKHLWLPSEPQCSSSGASSTAIFAKREDPSNRIGFRKVL